MTTPRYRKLGQKLDGIRHWSWFSFSKNRLKRNAGNKIRRASRRELKRHGRELIEEALDEAMEEGPQ